MAQYPGNGSPYGAAAYVPNQPNGKGGCGCGTPMVCDPAWIPRVPKNENGCGVGRIQCQQELSLDAFEAMTPGDTATLTFIPYREFTPFSLWNSSYSDNNNNFISGLVITSVTIGASEQIKGEVSADLYRLDVDRGHDIHWDQFNPNTPLVMGVRYDGAAVAVSVNFTIKGLAYKR